ncbi:MULTISPECIES: ATP-binding protein [unclassified Modicisalibacter]|uniref:ATP-binding protein n=1 Tax=unclassified Modicisalibacter TaxID=2679913 RepID=UPI001CCA0FDA|nr:MULTISPECIES: ATP-binding protein [unclassified Modicisalibacter]MBZ9558306.1 PAS domain S-box protein [Modicisalibacter sp. R2A 31.J]MBZ9575802.1 PAS domain S-box protein [Modicisalibacter sp. MOD 31.J]
MQATRLPRRWRRLLVLLVPLGLALSVWQAVVLAREEALDSLYNEGRNELRLSAAGVSAYLSRHDYLPRLLASREAVKYALAHPDAPQAVLTLDLMLDHFRAIADVSDIYLLDDRGTTLAASNWNLPHSFVGQNYGFRPYFLDAMQGREGRFYGLGTQSGERGYYFSAPVRVNDDEETHILGVVVVKVLIAPLEENWTSLNGELLISDEHGVVFMASQPGLRLTSLAPLAPEVRAQLRAVRRYDGTELPVLPVESLGRRADGSRLVSFASGPLAGKRFLTVTRELPEQGWEMRMLKPLTSLESAEWQAGMLAAGLYGVVILAGGIGWQRWRLRRERELFANRERRTLAEGQARVRGIIDRTRAGLLVLDEHTALTYLNPTAQALFGHAPEAVEGRHLTELLSPADARSIATLRHTRQSPAIEVLALRPGGERVPLELTVSQLISPHGQRWLATVFDISERKAQEQALARARDQLEQRVEERTRDLLASNRRLSSEIDERKRAEASLRQAQDELIQAAKLAVLGQMAAGINHELNQPLAAIRAYAENAQAFIERGRSDAASANLAQIVELTARMAEISAQLKQFSRKSGDSLAPVSVQAGFGYALRLYRARLISAGVEVVRDWPAGDVWVHADLVRLEQVLVNLIGNALQAMADVASPRLTLRITTQAGQVRIEVEDNGTGIDEDHLGRVFEPFFTTKATGKGLGLGLSISARIIDDLGGRLTAANVAGGGARFTITLPACAPPSSTESATRIAAHEEKRHA